MEKLSVFVDFQLAAANTGESVPRKVHLVLVNSSYNSYFKPVEKTVFLD